MVLVVVVVVVVVVVFLFCYYCFCCDRSSRSFYFAVVEVGVIAFDVCVSNLCYSTIVINL